MSAPNLHCFIEQPITPRILENVTRYCNGCYCELKEGGSIYYDTDAYRYLCFECARSLAERMDEECEVADEEEPSLF